MLCMRCGRDNIDNGSGHCMYCQAKLPSMSLYQVMNSPAMETSRLDEVKRYCDGVLDGSVPIENFADFISATYNHLVSLSSGIYEIVEAENYIQDSPEEIESGYEGMNLWETGLMEIYAYIEDSDEAHIKNGLDMITRGNELVNVAMQINREQRNIEGVSGKI